MNGLAEQLAVLPHLLSAHLQLTMVALLVATVVSVPLGIAATRIGWLEQLVVGTASIIQTIPGLALLAVMVPLLSALGASGIGFVPAIIGLTLYCVFPILIATVTGIREVDPAMIEAARGVGMTDRERLRLVELPLAAPVIVSGLRTATVWCVGMATLSTPVGAPSLGNYIFGGLQTRNYVAVLVGCVAAAVLAQLLDRVVRALESGVRTRSRVRLVVPSAVLASLYLYTAVSLVLAIIGNASDEARVRVGAKTFTEQYVLAELLADVVARETGQSTEIVSSLGSTVAFDALCTNDIDLYVDYSGTIWATVMNRAEAPPDRADVLDEVRRYLADEHGVVLVAALGFENTYALAMQATRARALRVRAISDLAPHAASLSVGGDFELFDRTEWRSVIDQYHLAFEEQRVMDPSLMYEAIDSGSVDLIGAYSTDGRIAAYDLVVLDDDRGAIPPYDAILLASPRLARDAPEVIEALRALEGTIDADRMRRANASVDRDGRSPRQAAARLRR